METVFVILYPAVAFISAYAYIPQIRKLWSKDCNVDAFCMKSWLLWLAGSVITLGYAAFVVSDLMFSITALFAVIMNMTCVCLLLNARYVRTGLANNVFVALFVWCLSSL